MHGLLSQGQIKEKELAGTEIEIFNSIKPLSTNE